jgi:hypothetical protein
VLALNERPPCVHERRQRRPVLVEQAHGERAAGRGPESAVKLTGDPPWNIAACRSGRCSGWYGKGIRARAPSNGEFETWLERVSPQAVPRPGRPRLFRWRAASFAIRRFRGAPGGAAALCRRRGRRPRRCRGRGRLGGRQLHRPSL